MSTPFVFTMVFYLILLYNIFSIIARKQMVKMKKNNKGFVLVETLVVTVFVAAVFSVIYINFYPLIGEYERRDFYDDLDSKYGAYWVKVFLQRSNFSFASSDTGITSRGYYYWDSANNFCEEFPDGSSDRSFCFTMTDRLHVKSIIVTRYRLDGKETATVAPTINFKQQVMTNTTIHEEFQSYIEFLPNYVVPSLNGAKYRVLVEFERVADSSEDAKTYYTYANMEVVR